MTIKKANKQYNKVSLFLLSTCVFLFATNADASEYQNSYPVTGTELEEVLAQIQYNSESPEGAFGYTELNTHAGWTAKVDADGSCTIETVDLTYDITIYMPEWLDKHTAKQCLQDNWDTAWHEVLVHEQHHRDLYRLLDGADIERRIAAIQPRKTCDALEAAVNLEVKNAIDINSKLHDDFHARNSPATLQDC